MRIIRKISDGRSVFTVTHDFGIPNLAVFFREEELTVMLKSIFPTLDTCSVCWMGESTAEFMIIGEKLALTNASIRETIEKTSFSFKIPPIFTVGEIDYRKNEIVIEECGETFKIKLTFSFVPREFWNGNIPEGFLEKRCKRVGASILSELYYKDIINPQWIEPTTIQFQIKRNPELGLDVKDDIRYWFKYNGLEDTVYEGNPGDFWLVSNLEVE